MAVNTKNIKMLKGYRKPLSGGPTHFIILMSQFSSGATELQTSRVYISMKGGGVGIIGQQTSPDLNASLYALQEDFNASVLQAYYTAQSSGVLSLSGSILGGEQQTLGGFYLVTQTGNLGLPAYYTVLNSGYNDLTANIFPIGPVSLSGQYLGVEVEDLYASIDSIEPTTLTGSIHGIPYQLLQASIDSTFEELLLASYSGFEESTITASYTGTGSEVLPLVAEIYSMKGIEEESLLGSLVSGIASGVDILQAYVIGHTPTSLSGNIEPIPPIEMYSYINPVPSGVALSGTIIGQLPSGSLPAYIESTGGYTDLYTSIRPSWADQNTLFSSILGTGEEHLSANINTAISDYIAAVVNPSGAPLVDNLEASIVPTYFSSLSGGYTSVIGNTLQGNITAIEGDILHAIITPRVFFIDSTIPLNTFPFNEMKAVINSDVCEFSSAFNDLHVTITGTLHSDLTASMVAIAGQYAMAHDELEILLKNEVVGEDWIPYIIDQPAVIQDALPFILTTAPVQDLQAIITGLPNSSELEASITPKYYSNVLRDSKSIVEWVNTKTGERKTVRLYFRGNAVNFYYSDLASDTFSFTPDDYLEIEIESYDKIAEENDSLLAVKTSVKTCTVDNLQDFATIDEAIKFGITCAVSEINDELRAVIVAKGGFTPLTAEINPLRIDETLNLNAKYFPTYSSPLLSGTIIPSGGYDDLHAYVNSLKADHTSGSFTDTLGEKYIPKLVTHGNNDMSIVLTKVVSTDKIPVRSPDLHAEIVGIGKTFLGASISG